MTDEELAAAVLSDCDDAVVVADRDGVVLLWNRAAEVMFGYAGAEAVGASLDLIVPDRFRERHWDGYRRVMASGTTAYAGRLLAVPAVRKDGQRISIEFTVTLVRDGEDVVGAAAIVRDVTTRRQEEQRLRARLAELDRDG